MGAVAKPARRYYCRCGTRLAKDNHGRLCTRCARLSRDKLIAPPEVPPEFWDTDQFREAFAAQHMGWVSRAYRTHPYHRAVYGPGGISQTLLGQWVGLRQPHVSRFQTGPPILHLDTLRHWVTTLRIPSERLWFDMPGDKGRRGTTQPAASRRPTAQAPQGVPTDSSAPTEVLWTPPARELLLPEADWLTGPTAQELVKDWVLSVDAELVEAFSTPRDYLAFLSSAARCVPGEQGDRIYDQLSKFLRRWAGAMNRRDLFQLFGWGAVTIATSSAGMGLDDEELERLARAVVRPSRVDARVIDHLAAMLRYCKQQDDMRGPRAVVQTVLTHRQLARHLLTGRPARLRPRLFSVYSGMSSSAGDYFFDLNDLDTARYYYEQARAAAHEARNAELSIYALCSMSYAASSQGKAYAGIDLAAAAESLALNTGDPLLRVCAAERAGTAYAADGQYEPFVAAFNRAQEGLLVAADAASPESPAYYYHEGLLASHQSECLLRLGKPKAAAACASTGLAAFNRSYVDGYALCRLHLGNAYLQLEEIEEAAGVIGHVAGLAAQNRQPRLMKELRITRAQLQPWQDTPAVKALDERLVESGLLDERFTLLD